MATVPYLRYAESNNMDADYVGDILAAALMNGAEFPDVTMLPENLEKFGIQGESTLADVRLRLREAYNNGELLLRVIDENNEEDDEEDGNELLTAKECNDIDLGQFRDSILEALKWLGDNVEDLKE